MMRFYIPAASPEDWKTLLADPEKHWRVGYSAHALATCWQNVQGFPVEVVQMFQTAYLPALQTIQPLVGLPEYRVRVPGRGRESQNDLFVLAKAGDGALVSIMVEGKVNEPFGQLVGDWKADGEGFTANKQERLAGLTALVGLAQIPDHIRYQLVHRIVSALITAQTFNAAYAIMLVHSFSPEHSHWDAFVDFVALYGKTAQRSHLIELTTVGSIRLLAGWAVGALSSLATPPTAP